MSKKPDGGPAFPQNFARSIPELHGMSLRDYFAGQAIMSLIDEDSTRSDFYIAQRAYEIADAMIKARGDE